MLSYFALHAVPTRRQTVCPPILAATARLAHVAVSSGRPFRPSAVDAATATSTARATRTTSRFTDNPPPPRSSSRSRRQKLERSVPHQRVRRAADVVASLVNLRTRERALFHRAVQDDEACGGHRSAQRGFERHLWGRDRFVQRQVSCVAGCAEASDLHVDRDAVHGA